jgi:anti-sigma B factor antagonist
MTDQNVSITVRKNSEKIAILDVRGEVNRFAENVLMDAYTQATSNETRVILLNFTDLAYMNSSGIGLFVTLLIRANRQKQRLLAYGLSEHYRQIFELTRLNEAIQIFKDEPQALAVAESMIQGMPA